MFESLNILLAQKSDQATVIRYYSKDFNFHVKLNILLQLNIGLTITPKWPEYIDILASLDKIIFDLKLKFYKESQNFWNISPQNKDGFLYKIKPKITRKL